jgi:hypothetical protein
VTWWTAALALGFVAVLALAAWSYFGPRPSADREWAEEHRVAPEFLVEGDALTVRSVRNFRWRSESEYDASWEKRSYDLSELRGVWYILTPFSTAWRGPAHALVSFQFGEDEFLAVSVEARREVGERYGLLKGMLRRFEIIYVAGDERDLVGVRAIHRGDSVFTYPARASAEGARALLLDMADEANRLRTEPVFYHTVSENCTTRLLDHVNRVAPVPIRWSWQILLPGYSDALAHRLGILDTDLPLDEARQRWYANDRSREWRDAEDFSVRIREGAGPETRPAGPALPSRGDGDDP